MAGLISFGKPSRRPLNATRKVQKWLTSGEALQQDGSVLKLSIGWVAAVEEGNGLLRVEEVECNIPGCAPIETLVTFLSENFQAFAKVMKPIAEVDLIFIVLLSPNEDDFPYISIACSGMRKESFKKFTWF
jgi:hypothetical protein